MDQPHTDAPQGSFAPLGPVPTGPPPEYGVAAPEFAQPEYAQQGYSQAGYAQTGYAQPAHPPLAYGPPPGYGPPPTWAPPVRNRRSNRAASWLLGLFLFLFLAAVLGNIADEQQPRATQQPSKQELQRSIDDAIDEFSNSEPVVTTKDRDRRLELTSRQLSTSVTMSVPKGWEARVSSGAPVMGDELIAVISEPASEVFVANYVLTVSSAPALPLRQLADAAIDNNRRAGVLPQFDAVGGPVATKFGGRRAVQRDYKCVVEGTELRGRLVVTVVDERPVVITLTTTADDFPSQEKRFARFLASARGN